jgi:hypothetical protein
VRLVLLAARSIGGIADTNPSSSPHARRLGSCGRSRPCSELVLLYWRVGTRIRTDLLDEERAPCRAQIVTTESAQLVSDYGHGFSRKNHYRMMQFAKAWPDPEIVWTLSAQLGWSHVVELLTVEEQLPSVSVDVRPLASQKPLSRATVEHQKAMTVIPELPSDY